VPTPAPSIDAGAAAFSRAVAYVIDKLEGGGKVISDSGGTTRWGISKKSHPDKDIANLTREDAEAIYRRSYWNAVKADLLPAPLALLVFDAAVNMGPRIAIQILQRVLDVEDDGNLGPQTLLAVRSFGHQDELLAQYNALRIISYVDLVRRRPYHQGSLWGWVCRVQRLTREATIWSKSL
jgi:lysozyme family protein